MDFLIYLIPIAFSVSINEMKKIKVSDLNKNLNNINYRISLGDDRKVLEFLSNTSKVCS